MWRHWKGHCGSWQLFPKALTAGLDFLPTPGGSWKSWAVLSPRLRTLNPARIPGSVLPPSSLTWDPAFSSNSLRGTSEPTQGPRKWGRTGASPLGPASQSSLCPDGGSPSLGREASWLSKPSTWGGLPSTASDACWVQMLQGVWGGHGRGQRRTRKWQGEGPPGWLPRSPFTVTCGVSATVLPSGKAKEGWSKLESTRGPRRLPQPRLCARSEFSLWGCHQPLGSRPWAGGGGVGGGRRPWQGGRAIAIRSGASGGLRTAPA